MVSLYKCCFGKFYYGSDSLNNSWKLIYFFLVKGRVAIKRNY